MINLLIAIVIILTIVVVTNTIRVFELSSNLRGVDPPIVPKNHHV
jgi:hypothetical protein